jgi:hypothetical protein
MNGWPAIVWEKVSTRGRAPVSRMISPRRTCRAMSPSLLMSREPNPTGMTTTQMTKMMSKSDGLRRRLIR